MASVKVYRYLQQHLDTLPIGYPPTESGVEIRILKHLFTPQEAKIATQLSLIPEPLDSIYTRVGDKGGMSIEELEGVLDQMVYKGTVLRRKKASDKYYGNAMLVIGMFEYQVERLTKDFIDDILQYFEEAFGKELYRTKIPQLRTIPVAKSVTNEHKVSTYDDVRQLIGSIDGTIAVANCICRQAKDVIGEGCSQTDLRETCLIFRGVADHYLSLGIARSIKRKEALDILRKAQAAGLVLQPENSQRPYAICCCCGDCCGILTTVKRFPRPAELYASNYYAEVDAELCTGCEICIDRCQLDALKMVSDIAEVNRDHCIGCGNCVVTCTAGAIQLQKKDEELLPPINTKALYMNIMSKKMG
jgi:electron transport complex protein RnfB